jgi:glycosyltransferase involved in cell wall biosynthesis
MRLGLVIYGDLEQQTGGYLYDRKLVGYLQSQGDQVEIISLPKRSYPMLLLDNFSRHLKTRLLGLQVDILLQDELNHPSLFLLNKILRNRVDYPLVAIVHHLRSSEDHPRWLKPLYRWIERRYLQPLDGFIYNSHATQHSVEKLFPPREGDQLPYKVAYPGGDQWSPQISAGEIASRCHQSGPLRLFFAGNLIPRKGLHVLIESLEQLGRADFHLEVAGSLEADPSYSRAMRRLAEAKGLTATVTFLGSLSGQDFVAHLRTSHVTVIPSNYEGFGIVYLEGMGFGLPAIGSTAGGATEIIQPSVNGFLITPGDSTTLARYLHELTDNRQRLLEMSLAAYHHYQRQPTWEQSMGSVRQFLASASFPSQRPSSKTLT